MPSPANRVKISAGYLRSRLVTFPDGDGLRPTPDRVRQTLFNWLGQDLTGMDCLDLFAGTGVMGFEAVSRGAKSAVLVEKSAPVYQSLLQNQRVLATQNVKILAIDALHFLANNTHKYDVIFCDPPYHQQWLDKLLPILTAHIKLDGFVYVEAEYALSPHNAWNIVKQGKAGNVHYHLLSLADVVK